MHRPIMNPTYMDESEPAPRRTRVPVWRRFVLAPLWKAACWIARLALTNPLRWGRRPDLRVEDGHVVQRVVRALAYRLAFIPFVLAGLAAALVYAGTHPSVEPTTDDPLTLGVYYDPVNFVSADGTRLDGWLVPVLDARRVLEQKDRILRAKFPAVVLVHDFGHARAQMLPLVRPLHERGLVVLVVQLRGSGVGRAGTTFGLHEANDVTAAVDLLRRRPFVDPDRIALLGVGTGATAALIAADRDPKIAALVLDRPPRSAEQVVRAHVMPPAAALAWVYPFCKWTFEVAYAVNSNDLEWSARQAVLDRTPTLLAEGASAKAIGDAVFAEEVTAFLRARLPAKPTDLATTN